MKNPISPIISLVLLVTYDTTPILSSPPGSLTPVKTTCSENLLLFPANSADDPRQLVVTFSPEEIGKPANCSWIVMTLHENASNVFNLMKSYGADACEGPTTPDPYTALYDNMIPGYTTLIGDSCSGVGWKFPDLWGCNTTVLFTTNRVPNASVPVVNYWTFEWPQGDCSWKVIPDLMANGSQHISLTFPGHGMRFPNLAECYWYFQATVLNAGLSLRITSHETDLQDAWCHSSTHQQLTVSESAFPKYGMDSDLDLDLCQELDFRYTSVGEKVEVSLIVDASGGAPPLTIEYWNEPLDNLCPSIPLELTAYSSLRFFKGVNGLSAAGTSVNYGCFWKITSPVPNTIVRVDQVFNKQYQTSCDNSNPDIIQLDDWDELSLCDTLDFPVFSAGQSAIFQFFPNKKNAGKAFAVSYKYVPANVSCQGNPVELRVVRDPVTVVTKTRPLIDQVGNVDCRWLIDSYQTGSVIQARVHVSVPFDSCNSTQFRVLPEEHVRLSSVPLQPQCPDNLTRIYTARSRFMLLMYRREWRVPGAEITFQVLSTASTFQHHPCSCLVTFMLCCTAVFDFLA